ncbi:arsenate reductase (glutaredoxin) [Alteromonas pelagimontana]|uniref:Arsenate reductase n=1 Tax=Alteromonas pelagimontana TaxID=1858656 RepID=A0A6M4M8A0_9ALTE|nr:arsenate reductase (glutaredoxin) [Alteromonas pelagimontana]QJR79377.1 arsenate reductase (glutaredoxin) [Alteromonas pelagimontana]
MSSITILHNPRCSKSRQTLALLEEKGIAPKIVDYLKSPLSVEEIKQLFTKLALPEVTDMMRTKEAEFKEAGLHRENVTDEEHFQAIANYPKLLERPIVINRNAAKIGRPPEAVLDIL